MHAPCSCEQEEDCDVVNQLLVRGLALERAPLARSAPTGKPTAARGRGSAGGGAGGGGRAR